MQFLRGYPIVLIAIGVALLLGLSVSRLVASEPPATPRPAPAAKPFSAKPKPPAPKPSPPPQPEGLVVKRVLPIEGAIKYGTFYWDEDDVPAGPLTITVDLDAETMSVFRDGYEIGATAILYGADDKPTPLGVYPITQKDADHVSNLYDAPMPYMLRLTDDGVSIHGADVRFGYATHGCIGIPIKFAKLLYARAKLGDRVIITRGKRLNLGGVVDARG